MPMRTGRSASARTSSGFRFAIAPFRCFIQPIPTALHAEHHFDAVPPGGADSHALHLDFTREEAENGFVRGMEFERRRGKENARRLAAQFDAGEISACGEF